MKLGIVPKRTCGFLLSFIKKYPNNASRSCSRKLLIDLYISSKNYKEALILLEKIEALKINWPIKKLLL
jgi:hypothetical protein